MMYKVETHLHTCHTSRCGHLEAAEIARAYKAAGYAGVIVTDHYNQITYNYLNIDIHDDKDKLVPFLKGYHMLKEEGEKLGLRVYRGAEIRFYECDNDYLLYGYSDDLLADPAKVFEMGIAEFSKHAREDHALLIQAHPFRSPCHPVDAGYLDGIEVDNRNPRQINNNDLAKKYAMEHGLIETCGSDCHQTPDIGLGGIMMESLPEDDADLVRLIRQRRFKNL